MKMKFLLCAVLMFPGIAMADGVCISREVDATADAMCQVQNQDACSQNVSQCTWQEIATQTSVEIKSNVDTAELNAQQIRMLSGLEIPST